MIELQLHERQIDGKRLGRHIQHDPRSREYLASTARLQSVKHQTHGLPLDQGNVGSCTAEALIGAINTDPDYQKHTYTYTQDDAYKLYHDETELEHEPWPPNDPGGTGLLVCKAARKDGLIRNYQHAFGIDHALRALVLRPVITGVDWFSGFDNPDPNGLVQISGPVRGGHEIVAVEIDMDNQRVGLVNSWGSQWGLDGVFYWTFQTWDILLRRQGDVTVPIVI